MAIEFVFGVFIAFVGWALHEDVHATVWPPMSDLLTGRGVVAQLATALFSAKSPFCLNYVCDFLLGVDGGQSVLSSHAQPFANDGRKGLYLAPASDADFAHRMG